MSPVRPRSPAPKVLFQVYNSSSIICCRSSWGCEGPWKPTLRRGTQVVRERSAKPLCVGSIPTRASKSIHSTKCAMTFRSPRASGFQSPLWSRPCKVLAERWRIHYNTVHPHSSLGYRAPAPETLQRVEDLSVEELVTRLGVKAGTAGFDISVFA